MASGFIEIDCPCCRTLLKIDRETGAIISHKEPERPKAIEDLTAALQAQKPGDEIAILVLRAVHPLALKAPLRTRPAAL